MTGRPSGAGLRRCGPTTTGQPQQEQAASHQLFTYYECMAPAHTQPVVRLMSAHKTAVVAMAVMGVRGQRFETLAVGHQGGSVALFEPMGRAGGGGGAGGGAAAAAASGGDALGPRADVKAHDKELLPGSLVVVPVSEDPENSRCLLFSAGGDHRVCGLDMSSLKVRGRAGRRRGGVGGAAARVCWRIQGKERLVPLLPPLPQLRNPSSPPPFPRRRHSTLLTHSLRLSWAASNLPMFHTNRSHERLHPPPPIFATPQETTKIKVDRASLTCMAHWPRGWVCAGVHSLLLGTEGGHVLLAHAGSGSVRLAADLADLVPAGEGVRG